ncbi:D-alanine--D-alanine ligase [Alteromonadaceae bacterium M269]|nr:D-alanine--D-alanine ligase [Alteromonadaceae bacterium M269]
MTQGLTTIDIKTMGKVAVLLGGASAEREVSLRSGDAVWEGLIAAGIDAHKFDPSVRTLSELKNEGFDRVVIMLHGRGGEDGSMQGALQLMGLPYTGSDVLGSALAMDKIKSKQIWSTLGLPTAEYEELDKSRFVPGSSTDIIDRLGGTVMVKPAREGSSIGMAKVSSAEDLEKAINQAFEYDDSVLVERFITGREYTVSILDDTALPSISMSTPRVFYDYEAKYESTSTEYNCPSGLSATDESEIAAIAMKAFKAVGASGWGRVDFMCDEQGQFYLLEANTVPGMTNTSLVPMAAKEAGMSFEQLCLGILKTSNVTR